MIVRPEEWIKKPDKNGDGLLKAWVGCGTEEFPLPIETFKVSEEDVALHQEQDFEFILECTRKPVVFPDEKSFQNVVEESCESAIPIGLFPAFEDPDYVLSARIFLNGRVVETYADPTEYGFGKDDVLFSISCLGNEYDAVYHADYEDVSIKEGNIVSCVYWVHGWPREDE